MPVPEDRPLGRGWRPLPELGGMLSGSAWLSRGWQSVDSSCSLVPGSQNHWEALPRGSPGAGDRRGPTPGDPARLTDPTAHCAAAETDASRERQEAARCWLQTWAPSPADSARDTLASSHPERCGRSWVQILANQAHASAKCTHITEHISERMSVWPGSQALTDCDCSTGRPWPWRPHTPPARALGAPRSLGRSQKGCSKR